MHAVKAGLAQSIHNVFLISLAFIVVGLILVFFLNEIPLRGRGPRKPAEAIEEGVEEAGEVVNPVVMH